MNQSRRGHLTHGLGSYPETVIQRSDSSVKPFEGQPMMLPRVRFSVRQLMVAVAIVGGLIWICVASYRGLRRLERWGAAVHQRSTTYELAQWEREYASVRSVRDWRGAERAIDMLDYVRNYYLPGPGYRSYPRTEAALADQRERTLSAIGSALREYTGKDFGVDATQWRAWLAQQVQPQ